MTTKEYIKEVKMYIKDMPYMEIEYINENEIGLRYTGACLRASKMEELKRNIGLSDLFVTWCPHKNPKCVLLVGTF